MEKEKINKLKSFFRLKKSYKKKKNIPMTTASTVSKSRIEEELEQVFKKFDVNGDGKICSAELGSIMNSLGNPATEDELTNMIKEVDADGDGYIDLQEFVELNTKDVDSEEMLANLKDAFSVFDMDNNGSISVDELHNVLKSIGEECSLDECKNMINGVDANGDGIICFEEFKVMMMNGIPTKV
ncbi:hypothetical protein Leryth_016536 [Lithospermum erythrorhizon]|nr:hypothetical protein Leryth_016536 [Lithospermum erythrorhizon]